eukprot:3300442-Rhodomonas_salina.1
MQTDTAVLFAGKNKFAPPTQSRAIQLFALDTSHPTQPTRHDEVVKRSAVPVISLLRTAFVGCSGLIAFHAAHGLTGFEPTFVGVAGTIALALGKFLVAFLVWSAQPMVPMPEALQSDSDARFSRTSEGWLLCETGMDRSSSSSASSASPDGSSATSKTLFIFYCGMKLDPTHYAGQAREIAKLGISTLVLQSPFNLFFLPPTHARQVLEKMSPRFNRFVIGGHSLGALQACGFVQDPAVQKALSGVAVMGNWLRAAKPFDLSAAAGKDGAMPVALINGSLDALVLQHIRSAFGGDVAAWKRASSAFMPAGASLSWIEGGNHFAFCELTFGVLEGYPFQDNRQDMSKTDFQRQTAQAIARLCQN